jgi:hypothetical protein
MIPSAINPCVPCPCLRGNALCLHGSCKLTLGCNGQTSVCVFVINVSKDPPSLKRNLWILLRPVSLLDFPPMTINQRDTSLRSIILSISLFRLFGVYRPCGNESHSKRHITRDDVLTRRDEGLSGEAGGKSRRN